MKRFLRNPVVSTFQKYGIHNKSDFERFTNCVVSTFQKYGIHNELNKMNG